MRVIALLLFLTACSSSAPVPLDECSRQDTAVRTCYTQYADSCMPMCLCVTKESQ